MKDSSQSKKLEKPTSKKKGSVFEKAVAWLDKYILPVLSTIVILGLAVRGLLDYMPNMSEQTQLVLSIVAVAFLAVKAFKK